MSSDPTLTTDTDDFSDRVERALVTTVRDEQPAFLSRITVVVDAHPDVVRAALTDRDALAQWFAPVSGELRLGTEYAIEGNAHGTVTACTPGAGFALTWEFGEQTSWLEVLLTETDADADGANAASAAASTTVTLEHTAHVDPEFWDAYGPGATGVGWELGLLGLVEFLGSPAFSRPEVEAWMEAPAGAAFIAASSTGWAAASIAAGTDPAAASAAAERTTAFYTGE